MSVNEFDRTELQECQSDRNYCKNCKNGLCKFHPLVSTDDVGSSTGFPTVTTSRQEERMENHS
jgi:hypothetical protein